ncbi:MAG: NTP transferase domain-containing protein, partial [Acutalibacteraceae bacterium]|nr:NTP transferase domain-containing protein [Acutalibacteraceae bacterium]
MPKDITLVVMAAGMGSRFGGLKQIEPIGKNGEVLLDFSVYDARKAGFRKVVFIIKHAIEKDFKEMVGKRTEGHIEVEYVYQELDRIPEPFQVPEGREKPFGTGHALL